MVTFFLCVGKRHKVYFIGKFQAYNSVINYSTHAVH